MEKRRKRKKTYGVILILLACFLAIAVFFLAGNYFHEKQKYEAQLKHQTEALTEDLVSQLDQIDTSDKGLAAADNPEAGLEPTEVPKGVITETEKKVIGQELAKLEDKRKQKVLQTLSVAYSQALEKQKEEAFAKVEELVAQAKADWAAIGKDDSDESALKRGSLVTEYLAKSKVIEEQMDDSFNALVTKMEEQLKSEGIDPTEITAKYKEEYERIKEENRKAMMDKAWDAIKE